VGWKVPARGSRDQAPMAVLAELLSGSDASLFYQGIVKGRQIALNVSGGFGLTGPFEYGGPTLFTVTALYKPDSSANALLAALDEDIARVAKNGVDDATLKRVKTSMLAEWNNDLENILNRADTMAKLQTIWGDANVVNQVPGWIEGVTSADIQRVAATYLVPANRTVIDRKPVAKK
jgi:zinc protease